jgi:hypothetical protein
MFDGSMDAQCFSRFKHLVAIAAHLVKTGKVFFHVTSDSSFVFVATLANIALPNFAKFSSYGRHGLCYHCIQF